MVGGPAHAGCGAGMRSSLGKLKRASSPPPARLRSLTSPPCARAICVITSYSIHYTKLYEGQKIIFWSVVILGASISNMASCRCGSSFWPSYNFV